MPWQTIGNGSRKAALWAVPDTDGRAWRLGETDVLHPTVKGCWTCLASRGKVCASSYNEGGPVWHGYWYSNFLYGLRPRQTCLASRGKGCALSYNEGGGCLTRAISTAAFHVGCT
eukprot:32953-Pelagomonas_calceolata.AAC.3